MKEQNFPVVGIGASSGGLEAIKKLLQQIPADSGMAYIILQHLSSDHRNTLSETLSNYTQLPVNEIISNVDLQPNQIYIIPDNNNIVVVDDVLKLQQNSRSEKRINTIDIFFESLAKIYKSFTIGIILSGTSFEGTIGLKKVKEAGGATLVQDPDTAEFKGMPQNAIDADVVDYVLAPEKIPSQLLEIQKSYEINHAYYEDENLSKNEEEILLQIINLIFLKTGNDFRHYKQATIRRRIARRMVIVHRETLQDYYFHIRNDKTEQELLFNDFLIPVTYFFRDDHFFESLPRLAFPRLLENTVNNSLRIWVAGCATGEEAYSLAISLHEYLTEKNSDIKVQIFASDISEKCITKARTAIYSAQDVQHVSSARLNNYFTKRDGNYHINKVIRDMCVFAVHNFIKDPPFAKIDLVSCRNVLIYLDSFLQNKVLTSFHYSLKEKGMLFLGSFESVNTAQNLFAPVGKHEKIYSRKFVPGRYEPQAFKPVNFISKEKTETPERKKSSANDFLKAASDILYSDYTPANVIVNEHLDIVHFHGDTSPFLLPSPGKPNFNILKMARDGISFELRNAFTRLKNQKERIIKDNIIVKNQPYLATFEIVPLLNREDYYMVLFTKKSLPDADTKSNSKNSDQIRIQELENELTQLREDIKRITEEQQTAFEELQTTNEELLSSSEELQAMNEELETSTEELQSNNEELMCVNDELVDRQAQLISMRNYSESIINTIHEPLLIVDKDFSVKSANPAFYKYFQTTEKETEGYSLFEIGDCHWNIPEFKDPLHKMLLEKGFVEDFKIDITCKGIGKKSMVINAHRLISAQPPGMILLAIEDITDLVKSNELLKTKNSELQNYNEQLEAFSVAASHDLQEPLRKIQMFGKRIIESEKNLTESSSHNLERILASSANMSQLITDLINYSRVNFVENEYTETDLNVLLKKIIADLKDNIAEKNATITVSPLPKLKVIPYQIQQLFINLIMNSMKYISEGTSPNIKIETKETSKEEIIEIGGNTELNYAKICITDNGIGISKEYVHKIFDPFYRFHSNDQYKGSGLGLTIVKKIVSNHHGFITLSSEINTGTTFYIYIPV
ncbi:CheR family methyltransferase [Flavobacterium sp. HTF]|uniref:CheR family methyltransferase n=1 Tax=Flavobacterium sp. HTF TaxID=2170732 RepID=UPI000D5D2CFE|nr:CheR family methyltransferase [Flavobacterium sp. HTF]PWB22635.1 hypothetical protein DCO46_16665 [Flavobacterium sp. HTF]